MEKRIAILGATGSVGLQARDVAKCRGYKVDYLSASKNVSLAEQLARELGVSYVAMADEAAAQKLRLALADTDIKVLAGDEGIIEGIAKSKAEVFVNSIIGAAGLKPSLAVIESSRRLALANKESLVIAGDIVMSRARECGAEIIPVDSEHSAIFQSLKAGKESEIKRIILTASGGPFYGKTREELSKVTLADTLAHPTWKMGKKITVDSATLMNKGFEVIEAAHLFNICAEKILVAVHRESILHSAVEYIDNSIIGEFSVPDMRMCVQYAVDYPERCSAVANELDLFSVAKLTFSEPDTEAFPLLSLAKRAMSLGGAVPCVLNAADEVAVAAFLEERLSFLGIADAVFETVEKMSSYASANAGAFGIDALAALDREARKITAAYIEKHKLL